MKSLVNNRESYDEAQDIYEEDDMTHVSVVSIGSEGIRSRTDQFFYGVGTEKLFPHDNTQ